MLLAEESGGVSDGNLCLEMVAGEQYHLIAVFRLILNRFRYDEHLLLGILFLQSRFLNGFHEEFGTTVEDGQLRTVHLNETVVHAHSVEGRERVLHGADFPRAAL